MQRIVIEVNDGVLNEVLRALQRLHGVKIDRIDSNRNHFEESDDAKLITLQSSTMKPTWDNPEDERWNEL